MLMYNTVEQKFVSFLGSFISE